MYRGRNEVGGRRRAPPPMHKLPRVDYLRPARCGLFLEERRLAETTTVMRLHATGALVGVLAPIAIV